MGVERAVVLLSGGLDSATCAAIASKDHEVYALTFDYGGKHAREIVSAKYLAKHLAVKKHLIVKVDLAAIGGSSLLDESTPVTTTKKEKEIGKDIPSTYVPARNLTFLSMGVALAEAVGAGKVFIGANAVDYSGYPDCRPEFINAFQKAVDKGTKCGVNGKPVKIIAPLIDLSKSDIIKRGKELGVPFEKTWTCYLGGKKACGKCEACVLRLAGFREAGLHDPIEYEH